MSPWKCCANLTRNFRTSLPETGGCVHFSWCPRTYDEACRNNPEVLGRSLFAEDFCGCHACIMDWPDGEPAQSLLVGGGGLYRGASAFGCDDIQGLYRLIGTIIGGAVTVVFVPHLVNSPEILTLAIGLWMGLCLVISLLDGTPRSYLFMLAGYTVAIASFAVVQAPETTFDYALGRVEEIAVGIICAAVVNRLVFPRHSGPVLVGRIDNWLRDGSKLAVASMRGEGDSPEFRRDRQRLAADTLELRNLTTHVAYDTSSIRNVAPLLHVLQQRMVAVLPIISSLHDVLLLKPGEGKSRGIRRCSSFWMKFVTGCKAVKTSPKNVARCFCG